MSYARRGEEDSDVYVYASDDVAGNVEYVCSSCTIAHDGEFRCAAPAIMVVHLVDHRRAGHSVPDDAFRRLRADALEEQEEEP